MFSKVRLFAFANKRDYTQKKETRQNPINLRQKRKLNKKSARIHKKSASKKQP